MELWIPLDKDCGFQYARVKRRAVEVEGKPVSITNNKLLLESIHHEIKFANDDIEFLTAVSIGKTY